MTSLAIPPRLAAQVRVLQSPARNVGPLIARALAFADQIGIRCTPALDPVDEATRRTALAEIIETLDTDDLTVLAFWVAVWWAPLSVSTVTKFAAHLGIDAKRLLQRATRVDVPKLQAVLRHAKLTRIRALARAGWSLEAIAHAAGFRRSSTLGTWAREHDVDLAPDSVPGPMGLALLYVRAYVRPHAARWRRFAPFVQEPTLPRAMARFG